MDKEKFRIPMPAEETIQSEISKIISGATQQKESFGSYLKSMYQQVGIRYLFSGRSGPLLMLFTVITLLSIFFIRLELAYVNIYELYFYIFVTSPILFLVGSVYSYINKIKQATFEVEMVCKYNVYQVTALWMLVFSVFSILVNTLMIVVFVLAYQEIQFMRAFMISITALFTFSTLFLYVMMKRRSTLVAVTIVTGWIFGNIFLLFINKKVYIALLVHVPLLVYGIVLVGSLYFYVKSIDKLIHFKHAEGAS